MDLKWLFYVTCAITTFGDLVTSSGYQECLRSDSISCLQMQLFRAARGFVEKSSIEIVGGIELVKVGTKQGKSLERKQTEERVENAQDVETRQKALETYLIATGESLWKERTLTWNPAQTAKALVSAVPETLTSPLTSFVSEARGKKKKPLKEFIKEIMKEKDEMEEKEEAKDKKEKKAQMLMPLLIALKLKFTTIAAIAGMVIAVIAKKAVLAGVISLLLSGFTAITDSKGLISAKPQAQASEVIGYQSPGNWEPYSFSGGKTFKLWSQGGVD